MRINFNEGGRWFVYSIWKSTGGLEFFFYVAIRILFKWWFRISYSKPFSKKGKLKVSIE